MSDKDRPNIVFIMADQLAASFINCYGSGVDSTPNLDRLAATGCRFDRFYSHCPVCAPNRATIYTGRSIDIHGITTNNLELSNAHPTYVDVLRSEGYYTGGFGKFHQSPMQHPLPMDFSSLGFDESIPTEDPKLGPWLDWIRDEHPNYFDQALAVSWPMPYISSYGIGKEDLRQRMQMARKRYLEPKQAKSLWHHMYSSPLPAELHQTTWITDLGIDFIRNNHDKPFFCHLSYVDPHDPYDPPAPYDCMFEPQDMKLPIPMAVDRYKTDILNNVLPFAGFENIREDDTAVRRLRALYHGSIKFIDDQIGRVLDVLNEVGQSDETVIIFTTDHGDMMGDHGFMTKGVKHYDSSVRCPLIISGKGVLQGKVITEAVSSLDLFPTLTDIGEASFLPPIEGQSLAPLCGKKEGEYHEKDIYIQAPYSREGHVDTLMSVEGWRLSVYEDGEIQLFDLNNDPHEQCDLTESHEHQKILLDLMRRLIISKSAAGSVQQYDVLPFENGKRSMVLQDLVGPMTPVWTKNTDNRGIK